VESAAGAVAMVQSEEIQEHDTAVLRLVDLPENSDLYHLLWSSAGHTTIGSFVPSNLFSGTEDCPMLNDIVEGVRPVSIPYRLACLGRRRQAELDHPQGPPRREVSDRHPKTLNFLPISRDYYAELGQSL
jgi:hypothetical protein